MRERFLRKETMIWVEEDQGEEIWSAEELERRGGDLERRYLSIEGGESLQRGENWWWVWWRRGEI